MLIDCTTCVARDIACRDCVVTVLLDRSPPFATDATDRHGVLLGAAARSDVVELDDAEFTALRRLAGAGLVPPLRLVRWAGVGGRC